FPERNLEDHLKNDPDPFVRACLRENPSVFSSLSDKEWERYFHAATPLERLALVRNPTLGKFGAGLTLVEKIFDLEDTDLGIDRDTRKELILAFLTNTHALKMSCWDNIDFATGGIRRGDRGDIDALLDSVYHGYSQYLIEAHFSKLWMLISKWPQDMSPLQVAVYCHIGTDDKTKAHVYKACDVPECRYAIPLYTTKSYGV